MFVSWTQEDHEDQIYICSSLHWHYNNNIRNLLENNYIFLKEGTPSSQLVHNTRLLLPICGNLIILFYFACQGLRGEHDECNSSPAQTDPAALY